MFSDHNHSGLDLSGGSHPQSASSETPIDWDRFFIFQGKEVIRIMACVVCDGSTDGLATHRRNLPGGGILVETPAMSMVSLMGGKVQVWYSNLIPLSTLKDLIDRAFKDLEGR